MAKEAALRIKTDSDLKDQVELLYEKMGTSFAEAVRISYAFYDASHARTGKERRDLLMGNI